MARIRREEIEFCIFSDGFDDGERYVFCRKRPKNKFIGFFTPWKQVTMAYRFTTGHRTSFDFEDVEKILDKIKTWKDFEEWRAEQKSRETANRLAMEERWNSLIK